MKRVVSTWTRMAFAALVAVLAAGPTFADPPHGKGKGKNRHHDEPPSSTDSRNGQFSVSITAGHAHRIAIDVGSTHFKPLPPGIRKNLARGKPLPPGIAKQVSPAMVARLPSYPGHEWRVVGTDLVLVAIATAVVVDVLLNVFD